MTTSFTARAWRHFEPRAFYLGLGLAFYGLSLAMLPAAQWLGLLLHPAGWSWI